MMNKKTYTTNSTGIASHQVDAVLTLLHDGSTVPFIARYRKEATGQLDEVQIRQIAKCADDFQSMEQRKVTILGAIADQGKLTDKLKQEIEHCYNATTLEDLYLPYKQKRLTKAGKARKLGLEPLAKIIMAQRDNDIERSARHYAKGGLTIEAAIAGAQDIIAEWISEHTGNRTRLREVFMRHATIETKKRKSKDDKSEQEASRYKAHYGYSGSLKRLSSHRLLAMLRAERDGHMSVKIFVDEGRFIAGLERYYIKSSSTTASYIQAAIQDSYKRLLAPSMAKEVLSAAKAHADKEAIEVFARNLKTLLLAPPLGQKTVMAIDPGFRTGCKVTVLDRQGQLLRYATIYPHPPQQDVAGSSKTLQQLAHQNGVEAVAIGNGTAGRETETVVRQVLPNCPAYIVNEAGASIYSASDNAREEFPDLDLTYRGAVSIGRRLSDPLAELIKIDPKSIGVGQYQHDVDQRQLSEKLDEVIIDCVNSIGVNVNTASPHLLHYVSGIGPKLASEIVKQRSKAGEFKQKTDLLSVKGFGAKTFEQAAGFLRIRDGEQPLDATGIHPERYALIHQIAGDLQMTVVDLLGNGDALNKVSWAAYVDESIGLPTLNDIEKELAKPGVDPRGAAQVFSFDGRLRSFADVTEGMDVNGVINNVTNFGAFVDIGIKENGLIHVSQMGKGSRVDDPTKIVHVGQQVRVQVVSIDHERMRIGLRLL